MGCRPSLFMINGTRRAPFAHISRYRKGRGWGNRVGGDYWWSVFMGEEGRGTSLSMIDGISHIIIILHVCIHFDRGRGSILVPCSWIAWLPLVRVERGRRDGVQVKFYLRIWGTKRGQEFFHSNISPFMSPAIATPPLTGGSMIASSSWQEASYFKGCLLPPSRPPSHTPMLDLRDHDVYPLRVTLH